MFVIKRFEKNMQSVLAIFVHCFQVMISSNEHQYFEHELSLWIKNGDDKSAATSTQSVEIKMPINHRVFRLKEKILSHDKLSACYDSTDSFKIYHAGKKLHDLHRLSWAVANETLICRLQIPEIYSIYRTTTGAKKFSFSIKFYLRA